MNGGKHYGHDEGAWFWGCEVCNPVTDELIADSTAAVMDGGTRVDWVCTVCDTRMSSWHGTPLKSCGHCGQSEVPLLRVGAGPLVEDGVRDVYQDVLALVKGLSEAEQLKLLAELPSVCPYDCDSCHDEDCPCERMGCAGDTGE